MKNMPLHQLREMVEGAFYHEPGKQRWAERRLWRQEHFLQIIGGLVGLGLLVLGVLTFLLK
jgi:hypothetical protein